MERNKAVVRKKVRVCKGERTEEERRNATFLSASFYSCESKLSVYNKGAKRNLNTTIVIVSENKTKLRTEPENSHTSSKTTEFLCMLCKNSQKLNTI